MAINRKKKTARRSGSGRSKGASGSSRFAKMFNKGKEAYGEGDGGFGRDEIDDGVYNAKLHSMERGTSQNGRDQVAEVWVITAGEYKGKKAYSYEGIDSDERVPYFLARLEKLGYDGMTIDGEDDLEAMLKEITKDKPTAKIRLKTKGEFQNLHINKLIDEDDEDEDDEEEDEDAEETEDEDDEEEKPARGRKKKAPRKKKPADEDDDEDEDEDEKSAKKKKKAAAADDDDEEEDEPKKKKKPAADDDDEDDKPGADDYPEKYSTMKADLEVFFKVNKPMLKDMGFFGGKPKKGAQKAEATYDEVMADKALIKEAWADNVWPLMQAKTWKKTKAAAAEMEDEDDDE